MITRLVLREKKVTNSQSAVVNVGTVNELTVQSKDRREKDFGKSCLLHSLFLGQSSFLGDCSLRPRWEGEEF